jgi:hypothetical protein
MMAMRNNAELVADLATLARLHAALDSVVETEQVIAAIHDSSTSHSVAVVRVGALLGEARELLRGLLVRPDRRHGVGALDSLAVRRTGS